MRNRRTWLLLGVSLLSGLLGCGRPPELSLSPGRWDFGAIPPTEPVEQRIEVGNPGRRAALVRLISTCACLTVEPDAFELAGGGSVPVLLRYDPSEDEGDVRLQVIARSGDRAGRSSGRQVLLAAGRVLPAEVSAGTVEAAEDAAARELHAAFARLPQFLLHYYYDPGCKGCELLLARQMVAAQNELGIRLRAERRDVSDPEVRREYLRRLQALGVEERAYPALVFGDTVLQGDKAIEDRFQRLLRQQLEQAEGEPR